MIRIGIIGAGIGGLTLAQLLRVASIPNLSVSILERDETPSTREQGYFLGLTSESCNVLKPTFDELPLLSNLFNSPYSSCQRFQMRQAENDSVLIELPTPGQSFIDRTKLRKALASDLKIEWNKKFKYYEEADDKVTAHFEDGTSLPFDIIVACDGASSVVRKQRAPELIYSDLGFTTIAGVTPLNAVPPKIRSAAELGLVRWLGREGHTVMMFAVREEGDNCNGKLLWVLSYPGQRSEWESRFTSPSDAVHEEYSDSLNKRDLLLKFCLEKVQERFVPDIAKAIAATGEEKIYGPRQIYSTQPDKVCTILNHSPSCRVFLIGDAAHATTTHRGLGANTAIADANDFSEVLQQAASLDFPSLLLALQKAEQKIVSRGQSVIKQSIQSTQMIHATGLFATVRLYIMTIAWWVVWLFGIKQ